MMRRAATLALVSLLLAGVSSAYTVDEAPSWRLVFELAQRGAPVQFVHRLTATWTPPTTGSPVVFYKLEVEAATAADTLRISRARIGGTVYVCVLPLEFESVRARAAGVDAQLRSGPWSEWADWREIGASAKRERPLSARAAACIDRTNAELEGLR